MPDFAPLMETIHRQVLLLESLAFRIGSVELNAYIILKGAFLVVAMLWLAKRMVNALDRRLARMPSVRASNRTLIVKIFQIFLYCLIFLTAMQMLGINMAMFGVFGGALGVGLGFGLQKIASNFISGIILLFEKSIEVGDVIEFADGSSGFVRQTYARYTLIEMRDGKDVMVPNEEFINQRVTNWTHSDSTARAEVNVVISYDSDVELARKLIIECAKNHPQTMQSMEVFCYVTNFTDNGIALMLHFWVPNIRDGRLGAKSDVMTAILKAFREHGISIPYPQRVVHHAGSAALPFPPASKGSV